MFQILLKFQSIYYLIVNNIFNKLNNTILYQVFHNINQNEKYYHYPYLTNYKLKINYSKLIKSSITQKIKCKGFNEIKCIHDSNLSSFISNSKTIPNNTFKLNKIQILIINNNVYTKKLKNTYFTKSITANELCLLFKEPIGSTINIVNDEFEEISFKGSDIIEV
jgi:hypothetical protein